jgi:hypothetical protein
MWNCGLCGCQAIAPELPFCPHCYASKEEAMPRSVAGAEPSTENALPGEPGYVEPEKDEPEAAEASDSENVTVTEAERPPAPRAQRKAGK